MIKLKESIIRISVISILLLWLILAYPSFSPLPQIVSKSMQFSLSLLNIDSVNYGKYLLVDMQGINRAFSVSWECSGLILYGIFMLGVFAFPKILMKARLMSILFLPLIFIANIFRMLLSVIIAKYWNVKYSVIFHNSIGQILIFGLAISIYVAWIKMANKYSLKNINTY